MDVAACATVRSLILSEEINYGFCKLDQLNPNRVESWIKTFQYFSNKHFEIMDRNPDSFKLLLFMTPDVSKRSKTIRVLKHYKIIL